MGVTGFMKMYYSFAIYNLPGYGLSTGKRASIDRFSKYAGLFIDLLVIFDRGDMDS